MISKIVSFFLIVGAIRLKLCAYMCMCAAGKRNLNNNNILNFSSLIILRAFFTSITQMKWTRKHKHHWKWNNFSLFLCALYLRFTFFLVSFSSFAYQQVACCETHTCSMRVERLETVNERIETFQHFLERSLADDGMLRILSFYADCSEWSFGELLKLFYHCYELKFCLKTHDCWNLKTTWKYHRILTF